MAVGAGLALLAGRAAIPVRPKRPGATAAGTEGASCSASGGSAGVAVIACLCLCVWGASGEVVTLWSGNTGAVGACSCRAVSAGAGAGSGWGLSEAVCYGTGGTSSLYTVGRGVVRYVRATGYC